MATLLEDNFGVVKEQNNNPKHVFLPHSPWDKMGELLANSGGRLFGLFDKLTSFFTSMNMYSSSKLQVSFWFLIHINHMALDTCGLFFAPIVTPSSIYLFLLVTGNANYIPQFIWIHTAPHIIQDAQNNVKGFTSRFIWYFNYKNIRTFKFSDKKKVLKFNRLNKQKSEHLKICCIY